MNNKKGYADKEQVNEKVKSYISGEIKSEIIHFWRILTYDGTFLLPKVCFNNPLYCFSRLLFVISRNEKLLLHKLDFPIFYNLTRCNTEYLKIGLRY